MPQLGFLADRGRACATRVAVRHVSRCDASQCAPSHASRSASRHVSWCSALGLAAERVGEHVRELRVAVRHVTGLLEQRLSGVLMQTHRTHASHACTQTLRHTQAQMHTHTHTQTQTQRRTHARTHTKTHTRARTHAHAPTHGQMQSYRRARDAYSVGSSADGNACAHPRHECFSDLTRDGAGDCPSSQRMQPLPSTREQRTTAESPRSKLMTVVAPR